MSSSRAEGTEIEAIFDLRILLNRDYILEIFWGDANLLQGSRQEGV